MALSPLRSHEVLKGKKVLLADDLDGCRVTGTLFLKIAGAEVDVASNGSEAVKKALESDFDAILMGIYICQFWMALRRLGCFDKVGRRRLLS